jgi:hypothetical protein
MAWFNWSWAKVLGLTKPNCTRWVSAAKAMTAWLLGESGQPFFSVEVAAARRCVWHAAFQDRCSTLVSWPLAAVLVKAVKPVREI